MNANDATLTGLAAAQTGSRVTGTAPHAPASGGFDLVLEAVAGRPAGLPAVGRSIIRAR